MYVLLFLLAAALSFLLAYPCRAAAIHFNVVDHPEKRKMHQIPIPLLGGVPVSMAFVAVTAVAILWWGTFDTATTRSYLGLLAGAVVILATGLLDDVRGLKAPYKFAGEVLAALVVVAAGARIDLFTNPLGDSIQIGWLGIPLTIFWVVGVTNAVNLIDGLDGLAVGIGGIGALGMFAVASGNPFLATLTIVLAGSAAGFLPHNFYPAKMFLGDTGSLFIGYTLAVAGLLGSFKATTATVLFLPIIVLGVPIFDTMFAIFRRARLRVSPFKADREHIHHRLVRVGLHHRNVVLVLYFVCSYLALTAYAIAQFPYQTSFLFLVLLTMGGIIGLRTLYFIEERLELGLAGDDRGQVAVPAPRSGNGKGGRRSDGTLLVCEVSGFGGDFVSSGDLPAMCDDIRAMLSRRLRVHSVLAEPSAPGQVLIILRTEPLKAPMRALVQDGLAWFLEDQRGRFEGDDSFPRIRWIPTAVPSAQSPDGGRVAPAPATAQPERDEESGAPIPFRDGRATVAGS